MKHCPRHPDQPPHGCARCKQEAATPEQIAQARALARRLARQEQDA